MTHFPFVVILLDMEFLDKSIQFVKHIGAPAGVLIPLGFEFIGNGHPGV